MLTERNRDQVSLEGPGESFAFIYSIEDPKGNTQTGGVGAQVQTCEIVGLQCVLD